MNQRDEKIYKHLMERYSFHWQANQYYRTNHDENLEYYRGYRNAGDYPLVYNENFNRILPIIYTILSRYMDQLYQGSNIVSVKPRKSKDIQRAKAVEGVLNFQLESLNDIDTQGGSYLTMLHWFFNALTFGKGIIKAYWRKEERITPKRVGLPIPKFDSFGNFQGMDILDHMEETMQLVYDGPYVEVLHNKLFLPHPEYKDIQKMPQVFCVYRKSIDHIKRLADKGVYKNIHELGITGLGSASNYSLDSREAFLKSLSIESANHTEDDVNEYKTPEVDITEAYGRAILEDEPYEVGTGLQIKGKEEEIICHIGNHRTILSLQRNTYGIRPFFDIGNYIHPELYWDLGMVELTKGIQNQVNNLANLRIQNLMMFINPMLKVQAHADIDPEALVFKPFGIIPVDDMTDVEALTIPDFHGDTFMQQERFYQDTIHDIMGMYCLLVEGNDDDYEILTDGGWKKFDNLDKTEMVMTLDFDKEIMSWQKPLEYIDYGENEYDCYHFKNQGAEFICSPEHRIPLISNGKKKIVEIKNIPEESYSSHAIPTAGFKWAGNNNWEPPFEFISKKDWCAFMGIWVAEGHTSKPNGAYQVGVAQDSNANPDKYEKIESLLSRLPFDFRPTKDKTKFYTYDKELYSYLEQFGKSADKHVPFDIKNSSSGYLQEFLDWYLMGDGWDSKDREYRFTTISKRLADDVQEIVLKLGKKANFRWEPDAQRYSGEIVENHRNVYLKGNKSNATIEKKKMHGRMTCLRVPNGIFLIRKGSKHIWTGNSYGMGQTPQRQERVGVVYGIQAMGEARAKLMLMSSDYLGIRPLLKYMMILNTYHLPSGFEYRIGSYDQQQFGNIFGEDIHPDFDFAARYTSMEPALGKQARLERLIQLAGMWKDNPWINQFQWNKTIMELSDIREAEYLLKSEQQFAQEMQQQAKMQMIAEQMKQQYETQGKLKISHQDFQEEAILAKKEHEYDMALEALKAIAK